MKRIGPVAIVFRDMWRRRYALAIEVTLRRRIYSAEVGFGRGFRLSRGWA